MSDFSWPSNIKPLTNKNYSTGRGQNLTNVPVVGGVARTAVDTTIEAPIFRLNFTLSPLKQQVILNFYDAKINHGANSFFIDLDAGSGIETMQVKIVPGTWNMSIPVDGVYYLAFSVQAESTASQLDQCTNLFDMYECYGDEMNVVFAAAEAFAKGVPSAS